MMRPSSSSFHISYDSQIHGVIVAVNRADAITGTCGDDDDDDDEDDELAALEDDDEDDEDDDEEEEDNDDE